MRVDSLTGGCGNEIENSNCGSAEARLETPSDVKQLELCYDASP